jgi:hypothetical protein
MNTFIKQAIPAVVSSAPKIVNNIDNKYNLERQYTLDKLVGPSSNQFLQRCPEAIPQSIKAKQIMNDNRINN